MPLGLDVIGSWHVQLQFEGASFLEQLGHDRTQPLQQLHQEQWALHGPLKLTLCYTVLQKWYFEGQISSTMQHAPNRPELLICNMS